MPDPTPPPQATVSTPAPAVTPIVSPPPSPPPLAILTCGPLSPQADEEPIPPGTPADTILSRIQLECDHETGVFFFRSKSRLYLRVVRLS